MKSMELLLDTNVVLNYLTGREDRETESSVRIIRMCAYGDANGSVSLHTISAIWYVLRHRPSQERRRWLRSICEILRVAGVSHDAVLRAIDREQFDDFEDCLVEQAALEAGTDYILTVNLRDYRESAVPALTPSQWLARWGESRSVT